MTTSSTGSSELLRVEIDGRPTTVRLQVDSRARRITLRVDPALGEAKLTLPAWRDRATALRFLDGRRDWLAARLAQVPAPVAIAPGSVIPLLGTPHAIRHDPASRHPLLVADGEICVGGPPALAADLVRRWLRAEARRLLAGRSAACARLIGRAPPRITVRDTRSRWGSCARSGALSYSWRLVLAPAPVLDYVVAHEVAHLEVFDHSPRFWQTVARLHPDPQSARAWLRRHGAGLHRFV